MEHPRWREGDLSTGFIAQEFPAGFRPRAPSGELALRLAAVAAAIDERLEARRRRIRGQMSGVRLVDDARCVFLGRTRHDVRIARRENGLLVRFEASGAARLCTSDWGAGQPVWRGTIDGADIAVGVRPILNGYALTHRGVAVDACVLTRREAELAAADAGGDAGRAPRRSDMPDAVAAQGDPCRGGRDGEGRAGSLRDRGNEDGDRASCRAPTPRSRRSAQRIGDRLAVDAVILRFA